VSHRMHLSSRLAAGTLFFLLSLNVRLGIAQPAAPPAALMLDRAAVQFHRPNAANARGQTSWSALKLSRDEQTLFGCGNQLAVWNTKTGKTIRAVALLKPMHGVLSTPDGKAFLCWPSFLEFRPANGLTPLEWWNVPGELERSVQVDAGPSQAIAAMAFLADDKSLICVGRARTVQLAAKLTPLPIGGFTDPRLKTLQVEAELPRPSGTIYSAPAVISRDGKRLAAVVEDRLQIIELASGRETARVETQLGDRRFNAFMDLSADGARGAVVRQPASESEAADVVIFDGLTGQTVATCRGHVSVVASLALTPDGKWLASGGMDGTARLWEAETGREVARFTGFKGPVTAVAIRADGRAVFTGGMDGDVQGWLIPTDESDASSGSAMTNGPGKTVDVNKTPIVPREVASIKFSPAQEELYLVVSADRMLSLAPKLAELPSDHPDVRHYLQRARMLGEYSRKQPYDAAVANQFEELPGILAKLSKESSLRAKVVREKTEEMRKAVSERREQKERNGLQILAGLGYFVIGSLPTYSNVHDPITGSTLTMETGALSPTVSEYGLSTLLNSLTSELTGQSQIESVRAITDETLRRVLENSHERDSELMNVRRETIEAIYASRMMGEKLPRLPLPEEKPRDQEVRKVVEDAGSVISLNELLRQRQAKKPAVNPAAAERRREEHSRKHLEAIQRAQEARCEILRRHLERHEPFSAAALVGLKGMIVTTSAERARQWHEDGMRIAKMASFLPAGDIYDSQRAELLGVGGDLVLRAAQIEAGSKSWQERTSEKAEAALPIIEAALRLEPTDPTGILREQKTIACCMPGRVQSGYELAASLRSIRGESQRFRFLMARAAYLANQPSESLAELELAIEKLGMSDIHTVRNCPDLPHSEPRFHELTTVLLECVCQSGLSGGEVIVINRSSFPLTNVRLQLSHPTRAGRRTTEAFVPWLPPGEETEVPYDPGFIRDVSGDLRKRQDLGTIQVNSAQGRATFPVK
jgi:WD40 repeat protein